MTFRRYTPDDLPSLQRIWLECGWFDSVEEAAKLESFLSEADCFVATIDDEAECAVSTHRGQLSYMGEDVELCHVSSVTTSWIGRKQGFASELTARAIAAAAVNGAEMAILGMFEQGFYDQLGFGTGPYEHQVRFDPATLHVPVPYRTPLRLTAETDIDDLHRALWNRKRSHGGIRIGGVGFTRAELAEPKPFALGYRDESGAITHFVMGRAKGESGPYAVSFMAYRNDHELLELMAVLKSLGDQVRTVAMTEPPEIQIQDLIDHPVRQRIVTRSSEHEATTRASAWWQARMLDVAAVVAKRRWSGPTVEFNLALSDPISRRIETGWPGVGGDYVIRVADESSARRGTDPSLPTMTTTVNAFTRMWIGARPASGLATTGSVSAPTELIAALDEALRLPTPRPGMFF